MSGYGFDAIYVKRGEKPVTICHRQSLVNPPLDTHTSPHCRTLLKHKLPSGYGPDPHPHKASVSVCTLLIMYAACSKIDNVSRIQSN